MKHSRLIKSYLNASDPSSINIDEALRIIKIIHSQGNIHPPKSRIKFPVFQGGGAKGGAYIGVYEALDKMGYLDEAECPGGASAGGIPAFFMSLGFDSEQFTFISRSMHFNDFIDFKKKGWGEFLNGHVLGSVLDVARYGAASPGKLFHQWASYYTEQVLGDKNATFRDLHNKRATDPTLKDLLFTATHYGTKNDHYAEQVFSFETTPDVVIVDAFRATISYPGLFEPWQVRQKEIINGKVNFKLLGFFADGGILNNFPITCYNKQCYSDPHYQTLERLDHHNMPVKVNPNVVGFSLTALEDLNEEFTPLTARVKALKQHAISHLASIFDKAAIPPRSWRLIDIAKGVIWHLFGKAEPENIADKQKVYFDQTVQVWPEDVTTLEFHLSKERLERLVDNGKEATQLWLEQFRDPKDSYVHKLHHDQRLSSDEEQQLAQDKESFIFTKLTNLFIDFKKEVKKQQLRSNVDEAIMRNARLRYLSDHILKYSELRGKKRRDITQSAFANASTIDQLGATLIEINRNIRWNMIRPEKILERICSKFSTEPKVAVQLLKSQLSNIIILAQQEQGQLLHMLVKGNNPALADKVLQILMRALKKAYYNGKLTSPHGQLQQLLSNANPSLFRVALQNNNLEMVKVLLKYGMSVAQKHPVSGRNALQEAIVQSHFPGFTTLIQSRIDEENTLANYMVGKDSLWEYILKTASQKFISSLCNATQFLMKLIHSTEEQSIKSVLYQLLLKGSPTSGLYQFMIDNLSPECKVASLRRRIASEVALGELDQGAIKAIDVAAIHQEPLIFNSQFKAGANVLHSVKNPIQKPLTALTSA